MDWFVMRTGGDRVCVMLARLMLKHRETGGTGVNRWWSRKRLGQMSLFCDFCFFDGITIDVSFGEWSSQLHRGHVLSGVIRSGFFFRELDSKVFGVYGSWCFNFQCFCFAVFVKAILDKFVRIARPFR